MSIVAVVAHTGKSTGGGLPELRRVLAREGISDPLWYEVSKSKQAPKQVRRALARGAEVIFAWGGDGLAQQCIDTLAGTDATLAIVPAGTANLLASNLGIPEEIPAAVQTGLSGIRRRIDVGTVNGECFAVMAGVGLDARMIDSANGTLKDTLGRVAYVWTGARNLRAPSFNARIKVDGSSWYRGSASCILLGNVGHLFAGIEIFEQARPDDGLLELGVVSADGPIDWARTIARTVAGSPDASPFVHTTSARTVKVKLSRKILYETRRRRPHEDTPIQDQRSASRRHGRRSRSRPDRKAKTRPSRRGTRLAAKLHIAGFNLLECVDPDEALEVASQRPRGEPRHLGVAAHRTVRAFIARRLAGRPGPRRRSNVQPAAATAALTSGIWTLQDEQERRASRGLGPRGLWQR